MRLLLDSEIVHSSLDALALAVFFSLDQSVHELSLAHLHSLEDAIFLFLFLLNFRLIIHQILLDICDHFGCLASLVSVLVLPAEQLIKMLVVRAAPVVHGSPHQRLRIVLVDIELRLALLNHHPLESILGLVELRSHITREGLRRRRREPGSTRVLRVDDDGLCARHLHVSFFGGRGSLRAE